jgi:hypothetical protein
MSQFNLNKYLIKQPYPSSKYYPYPEPTNTYGVNPLTLNSIQNVDIDDLQQIFAKGISDERDSKATQKILTKKLFEESQQLKDIKAAIQEAKLNQMRCQQIEQKQMLKLQDIIKDAEKDEMIYATLEKERQKQKEIDDKKQKEYLKTKGMILEQIREKERLKEEDAKKEYEKDQIKTKRLMDQILEEDRREKEKEERKKEINKQFMLASMAQREERKRREIEDEILENEEMRKYLEEKAKRESGLKAQKDAIQAEKDRIFKKLSDDNAREKAEKDYWESVRNELQILRDEKKRRLADLEEREKRRKMREDVINSALIQMKEKQKKKEDEAKMEEIFKKELKEQYALEAKKEMENMEKRKLKEKEFQEEVERLWKIRLEQYRAQKEQDIKELEEQKRREEEEKILIEQEKIRLIKENEDLLRKYNSNSYNKLIQIVQHPYISKMNMERTPKNKDIIYNNIFGNLNPNPPSVYPKYTHIKNFVYDINIQDIHKNLNMGNYPMYNATMNNNYDTYPTESEYRLWMKKNNQKFMQYAGGSPIRENTCYLKNAPRMRDVINMQNQTGENFGKVTSSSMLPEINSFRSFANKPGTSYEKSRMNYNIVNQPMRSVNNFTLERNDVHDRIMTDGNINNNNTQRFEGNQKVAEMI